MNLILHEDIVLKVNYLAFVVKHYVFCLRKHLEIQNHHVLCLRKHLEIQNHYVFCLRKRLEIQNHYVFCLRKRLEPQNHYVFCPRNRLTCMLRTQADSFLMFAALDSPAPFD